MHPVEAGVAQRRLSQFAPVFPQSVASVSPFAVALPRVPVMAARCRPREIDMTAKLKNLRTETTDRIVAGTIAAIATIVTLAMVNVLTIYCATGPAIASTAQWAA
jgi:hypothetical protein